MAQYLGIALLMCIVAGLPVAMEVRLRKRHPEVYKELVQEVVVNRQYTTRFQQRKLWRFLTQRSHKSLGDPLLSALSDGMLAGLVIFILVFAAGFIHVFGNALKQIL